MDKICKRCGEAKKINEFHRHGKARTGEIKYRSVCKLCRSKYEKRDLKKDREYAEKYRKANQHKINEYEKSRRQDLSRKTYLREYKRKCYVPQQKLTDEEKRIRRRKYSLKYNQQPHIKEKNRLRARRYYKEQRAKQVFEKLEWIIKNPEKHEDQQRLKAEKIYNNKLARKKRYKSRCRRELRDIYLRYLLKESLGKDVMVTNGLLELKRDQVTLHRLIKKVKEV